MKAVINRDTLRIVIDPTESWPKQTSTHIYWSCGFVPGWFEQYVEGQTDHKTIRAHMSQRYGFGIHPMTGHDITEELLFVYPEDPELPPLIHMKEEDGVELVQWQYGIVGFRDSAEDEWLVTRMD